MDKNLLKDVCVIIRSSGERTESLCKYAILQNGIEEDQIFIIKNISPFSRALKEGYRLALEKNKKYTFFIDADMIVFKDSLEIMLEKIKNMSDNVFFMNPLAFDYLTGQVHPNGPHLYNTKHIEKAISLVPFEENSRRPESYTVKQMEKKGYDIAYINFPSAMHEFEQYYRDIFNRSFNKFIKFPEERLTFFKRFKKLKKEKKDFEIAFRAFKYASINRDKLKLNNRQFDLLFNKLKIKEKDEINKEELAFLYNKLCKELELERDSYSFKKYNSLDSYRHKKVRLFKRILDRFKIYFSF